MTQTSGYKIFELGISPNSLIREIFHIEEDFQDTIVMYLEKYYNLDPKKLNNKNCLINYINQIPSDKKNILKRSLLINRKFFPLSSIYIGAVNEYITYDRNALNIIKGLDKKKQIEFNVDFKVSTINSFTCRQFLRFKFKHPKLKNPDQNQRNDMELKYWFTKYPGIRLLPFIEFLADTNSVESYNYLDFLKYFKDSITENNWSNFNQLIGQGQVSYAESYNAISEQIQLLQFLDGLQTPKLVHNDSDLEIHIPLIFTYNRSFNDKLNMSNFNDGTINIKGKLCPSDFLVKAAYFPVVDINQDIIPVEVDALEFEGTPEIVSEVSAVNDLWWAINHDNKSKIVGEIFYNEKYNTMEQYTEQKLSGLGEVLQMAIAVRPSEYENDFDKWHELGTVESVCTPVPSIFYNDANKNSYKVSISSASVNKFVSIIDSLDLKYDGNSMVNDTNAKNFNTLDVFAKSMNNPEYFARDRGIYYLNFNTDVNGRVINNVYNQNKFINPILHINFNKSLSSKAGNFTLNKPHQIIVFRKCLNTFYSGCDSMTRLRIR